MNTLREPHGTSRLGIWLRELWAFVRASEIRPGVGYRVNRTTSGTILDIAPDGFPHSEITVCDPSTGTEKTYIFLAKEKIS